MNIELEEVVGQDVSDDALEMAAGGAQGGQTNPPTCSVIPTLQPCVC
jgi:hypothetical protein